MKRKLVGIGVIALVLALLLTLAPSCGNGDEGEVKTLKMGLIIPLSGTLASMGVQCETGMDWAIEKVNGAGGIKVGQDAYMIELVTCDEKAIASEGVLCAQQMVGGMWVRILASRCYLY